MKYRPARLLSILSATLILAVPTLASAHVVVTPNEANVGERVTFSISVPNEHDSAVVQVKLDIPTGLEPTPTHKAGWDITTTKEGDNTTAITWVNGTIPVGERDDFTFRAQVPAKAGELTWKAYETYADGTVVSWDQAPSAEEKDDDSATSGPYSVTKIVDDIATDSAPAKTSSSTTANIALALAIVSLVIGLNGLRTGKK